jgi:SNF2 family DNA or RNA helicase
MALRGASGAAHYRFGLTGTPISGNPVEMWPLLHWIDEREWPAKTKWVDRMVSYTYDLWGGMEVTGIRPEAEDEFHASINPRMRRMTKDVVLPFLPPKVYEQRDVALTGKQGKAYQQMADDLVAKLDSGILLSVNPMVQTGRLIQFASAYGDLEVLPDGSDRLVLTDPSNKIDAFMADLEDFDGQAVVVFAQSKQLINLLSTTLTKKGIRHGLITGDQDTAQRQRTIEDFQDGHFNMVLCTIQAGGVGITLTRASVAVFLQRSWSPIDMQQAEDRIHRIGSEIHETVLIVNYVTPDTVEEAQIWALKHKNDLLQEIVRDAALMKKFLTGELGR